MSKRADASHSIQEHFRDREPVVQAIYDRILDSARRFGPVGEEAKKTSVHLTNRTAFAGVATRRAGLVLTLKLARDVKSPRVSKLERVSANRWHLEIKLSKPGDVDADLRGWLREAYTLAA